MPTTYTTKQAASKLQKSPNTLRNWSEQYGQFLSDSARPGHQPERLFAELDITKLTYVKRLRTEGMKEPQIIERMKETTFNDIEVLEPATEALQTATNDGSALDASKLQANSVQSSVAAQEAPQASTALIVALHDTIDTLQRRVGALEQRREPSFVVGLGLGAVGMGILFLLLIGLAVLYGVGR